MGSTPVGRAWAILLAAFCIFCTLVVTVPLSIRWHIIDATRAGKIVLEDPIDGAVDIRKPGETGLIKVTQRIEDIPEGTTVTTDEYRQAFLRLLEESTLILYSNTQLVLDRVRTPRYAASPRPDEIQIRVDQGRVAIGVAPPLERDLVMNVKTPHAKLVLREGSFSVSVSSEETELTIRSVRPGEAIVMANGEERRFTSGRYHVTADGRIEGPLAPEQDLIINGGFDAILDRGWEKPEYQRDKPTDPDGTVEVLSLEGKRMLAFGRANATTHGETSITQLIDQDIHDFQSLRLRCEVLVNHQSLAGGGYRSSEFPVMIELKYRDPLGDLRSEYWGFYYRDPGTGVEWSPLINGTKVPQGEWYPFDSGNLIRSLPGDKRPVHIDRIRVYASGWDWDSAITNIQLLVQE